MLAPMSAALRPIDSQRITDQVFKRLVDLLLSGELKPGDRLPTEAEISANLGAGRNSVREAMKVLQVLGIVERRQGDGSFVADPTAGQFDPLLIPIMATVGSATDLVELRSVFEVGTVDLVIDKVPLAELEPLRTAMERLERIALIQPLPMDEAVEADVGFHVAMAQITGNRALVALSSLIMRLFRDSMGDSLSSPQRLKETVDDHRAFFEAIVARDKAAAKLIIRRSFERWKLSVRVQR